MLPLTKYDVNTSRIVQGVYIPHNQINAGLGHKETCDLCFIWKQTKACICILGLQTANARLLIKRHNVKVMTTTEYVSGASLEAQMGHDTYFYEGPRLETRLIYF